MCLRTAIYGANIQRALREEPLATRALLCQLLAECLANISAPNGIPRTEQGIAKAVKRLTDEFGNFTIEDWRICLSDMEAGRALKHYNNTNLEWLIQCFQAYDQRKLAELRSVDHQAAESAQYELGQYAKEALEAAVSHETLTRSLAEFLTRDPKTSFQERDAMARRDVARREAKTRQGMRALLRAEIRSKRKAVISSADPCQQKEASPPDPSSSPGSTPCSLHGSA